MITGEDHFVRLVSPSERSLIRRFPADYFDADFTVKIVKRSRTLISLISTVASIVCEISNDFVVFVGFKSRSFKSL